MSMFLLRDSTPQSRSAMAKDNSKDKKGNKGQKGLPNRHLHARATFLYQAATYLTLHGNQVDDARKDRLAPNGGGAALAMRLGSHLKAVSTKAQIRLSADIKRTVCKSCSAVLVPGRTATHTVENASKERKKPWADVLAVACHHCGTTKRFPTGARRQRRKGQRTHLSNGASLEKHVIGPNASQTPAKDTDMEAMITPG